MRIDNHIYNCINLNEYSLMEKKDFYLSMATIIDGKGHDIPLKWAIRTNSKLLIVGKISSECSDYLKNLVLNSSKELNEKNCSINDIITSFENNNIIFIRSVDEKLKKEILASAKFLFLTVKWNEPFSLTVLESLASGTPVIASTKGSLPEIIHDNKNGILLPLKDFNDDLLNIRIRNFVFDNEHIKNFDITKLNRIYNDIFIENKGV